MSTNIEERNPGLKDLGRYEYGWADTDVAGASARRGLNEEVVRDISARKNEPEWMLKLRLKGLSLFGKKPMPTWGSDLGDIDFQDRDTRGLHHKLRAGVFPGAVAIIDERSGRRVSG